MWCFARFGTNCTIQKTWKIPRLKPATLLKVSLLYGCFSRFLNCANGIKSRKASPINFVNDEVLLVQPVRNILCNLNFIQVIEDWHFKSSSSHMGYPIRFVSFHNIYQKRYMNWRLAKGAICLNYNHKNLFKNQRGESRIVFFTVRVGLQQDFLKSLPTKGSPYTQDSVLQRKKTIANEWLIRWFFQTKTSSV